MKNSKPRSSSEDATGRNIRLGMAMGAALGFMGYFWYITLILFIVWVALLVFTPIKIHPFLWGLGIFAILSTIIYRAIGRAR